MSGEDAQLELFDATQGVVIRRSARARRLGLRVFPHGRVEVVAPPRTGAGKIEAFLRSHAAWIDRARSRFRAAQGDAGFAPPSAIRLAAIDEAWRVEFVPGAPRLGIEPAQNGGLLVLRGPADPDWRRQRLRAWLLARGRERLLPWLADVSAATGLDYAGAAVRRQRSRWGSCSARRTISLNCALLFLEPPLVKQLFVHELAHTRHLNHSPAFWRLVARLEPDFERLERGLKDAWAAVPAWVSYD